MLSILRAPLQNSRVHVPGGAKPGKLAAPRVPQVSYDNRKSQDNQSGNTPKFTPL
jgi:hypothetical protein